MVVFPGCKINIGLNIIRRRADGFHDLETMFYPVAWTDVLEIIPSAKDEFIFDGNVIDCPLTDNLCYKAYQLLKKDYALPPVALYLYKNIPSGAGLGGGSADAAFTLSTLNQLFSLQLSEIALMQYAAKLGSDCAFFIRNRPVFATGRGEVFTEIEVNLRGYHLLIVKPEVHVSTAEAYSMITSKVPEKSLQELIELPIAQWKDSVVNDFEAPLFEKHSVLASIKDKMYQLGAVYASMSGSGSAIYGLFDERIDLQKEFPDMVCWMKKF
jgi:4-diphosphocytidyl-2-C-methyl-D-erythritol kinase